MVAPEMGKLKLRQTNWCARSLDGWLHGCLDIWVGIWVFGWVVGHVRGWKLDEWMGG